MMDLEKVINYQKLHRLDHQKSQITDFKDNQPKKQIAQYINKNIDKMDDVERKSLLITLMDDKKIKCELLKYELRYLDMDFKISDFNKFINFVRNTLKKYHMKAGGFLCEDNEWSEHDHKSEKYPLKSNELIFDNSIKRVNRYDFQITVYISDLLYFINRHIDDNLKISYRLIEYTDEIYWMVLKLCNKNN